MDFLPQYSNQGYIHLVGRCVLSLSQFLFHQPCFAIESDINYFIKAINNRWAWEMVPEEGGATRQAELIAQGIHDNLWVGTTRHCHTENQWRLKYTYHARGMDREGVNTMKTAQQRETNAESVYDICRLQTAWGSKTVNWMKPKIS